MTSNTKVVLVHCKVCESSFEGISTIPDEAKATEQATKDAQVALAYHENEQHNPEDVN